MARGQFDVRLGGASGSGEQFASGSEREVEVRQIIGDCVDCAKAGEGAVAHTDGDRPVERDDR